MDTPLRTIVVGTTAAPESDGVVLAAQAAARAAGARLHLVHAFVFPAQYFGDYGTGQVWADAQLLSEHEVWRQQQLAEQLRRLGLREEEVGGQTVGLGTGHRLVTDVARAMGAGLIVVGASEGRLPARMLGSTADRILRQAACPVLVVRGQPVLPPRYVLLPVDMSELSAEAFAAGLTILGQLAGDTGPVLDVLFVLSHHQRDQAPQFAPEQIERLARDELEAFVAPWRARAVGQLGDQGGVWSAPRRHPGPGGRPARCPRGHGHPRAERLRTVPDRQRGQ